MLTLYVMTKLCAFRQSTFCNFEILFLQRGLRSLQTKETQIWTVEPVKKKTGHQSLYLINKKLKC